MSIYDKISPALGEGLDYKTCKVNTYELRSRCEQIEWEHRREIQEVRDQVTAAWEEASGLTEIAQRYADRIAQLEKQIEEAKGE